MEEGDRNEMPHVCICILVIAYYLQTANSDRVTGCRYSILTSILELNSVTLTTQAFARF